MIYINHVAHANADHLFTRFVCRDNLIKIVLGIVCSHRWRRRCFSLHSLLDSIILRTHKVHPFREHHGMAESTVELCVDGVHDFAAGVSFASDVTNGSTVAPGIVPF